MKTLFALIGFSLFSITVFGQCIASAGSDTASCGIITLNATENPTDVNTHWISQSGITFGSIDSPNSTALATTLGIYNLVWQITNNIGLTCTDTVAVEFKSVPTPEAGLNFSVCGMFAYICATPSTPGGGWSCPQGGVAYYDAENGNITPSNQYVPCTWIRYSSLNNWRTMYWSEFNGVCFAYDSVNVYFSSSQIDLNLGNISGDNTVCPGQNSVTYSVSPNINQVNYVWTLPSGASGTSSTNSITVNYGTSAISGNISVYCTNSCGNGPVSSLPITVFSLPSISVSNNGPFCTGNTVSISSTFISNAIYSWTGPNVFTSSQQNPVISYNADSILAGVYSLIVTTADGCSTLPSTTNLSLWHSGVDFHTNTQLIMTPPFAFQYFNGTPNPSLNSYTWYFGDGVSLQSNNPSVFHSYSQNGQYDVTLLAKSISNGCEDTKYKNGYLYCAGGTNCTHTSSIMQSNPISGCVGTIVTLNCNSVSGATYQWNYNGVPIPNSDTTVFYASNSGNYSITIIYNNCPVTSSVVSVNLHNPAIPQITSVGNLNYCGSGTVNLSTPIGMSSYLWSNGSTSNSITVTTTGQYTVQVWDSYGCSSQSDPFLVGASPMAAPEICLVGVNTNGNNQIVWNKDASLSIAYYKIYAEGFQTGIFNLIGSRPYDSLSVFNDPSSNPSQQSYSYRLSIVDTCNAETNLSAYHKTIHLTINQGMGTNWNLIWSQYEGFVYLSYNIYRGTNSSNMVLLTTVASNQSSYTDISAPTGNVYYQIEAICPNTCSPTKNANDYLSTKSNIASNNFVGIFNISQVDNIKIYPNPFKNELVIEDIENNVKLDFEIINLLGQVVINGKFEEKTIVTTTNLTKGIYIIKLSNGKSFEFKKIIKE